MPMPIPGPIRALSIVLVLLSTVLAQQPIWKKIPTTLAPSPRANAAMAYDSARQVMVLFGGGLPETFTWEWDGTSWTARRPAVSPPPRSGHAMAYDSVRGVTVMFGGLVNGRRGNDTWEWDGTNWTDRTPKSSPSKRYVHRLAYDSIRERTFLFGGFTEVGGHLRDTWEWDGKDWRELHPATPPLARRLFGMAYDVGNRRTVLFGGYNDHGYGGDTWAFDGTDWRPLSPMTPSPRSGFGFAFDVARQKTIMFGGNIANSGFVAETWEHNGRNWRRRHVSGPSARSGVAMAYDSVRQRIVMFGGFDSSLRFFDETWEYGLEQLTLTANATTVDLATGGAQTLTFKAGPALGNRSYWILGTASGTTPGLPLLGIRMPLNCDEYSAITIGFANSAGFSGFLGTLDASGNATATWRTGPIPGVTGPFSLHHVGIVFDRGTGQALSVTNPVPLTLRRP